MHPASQRGDGMGVGVSEGVEGMGVAVTGGLLASAVEPSIGGSGGAHHHACFNCGFPLGGNFCQQCGQQAHIHRTLTAFWHDILHGVLHFEGKIWRTLPKLLLKPGELTRRYIEGERARFVSPLALFLFSVFLMFAIFNAIGPSSGWLDEKGAGEAKRDMTAGLAEIDARLTRLRAQRAAALARGGSTAKLDAEIADAEQGRRILKALGGGEGDQAMKVDSQVASNVKVRGDLDVKTKPGTGFDAAYRAAKQNPKLLVYKLQSNAYKFSWSLIIISVPFVWLLFLWRRRPMYDHAIFVTYSIAAVSIVTIIVSLLYLAGAGGKGLVLAAMLFVPWHMYKQLRGTYGLRRFSALWRTAALLVFANIAVSLFAMLTLLIGLAS